MSESSEHNGTADVREERFYGPGETAPEVNVPLSPGVAAVIFDEDERILILKRKGGPYWSLPGGRQDVGESAPACCEREVLEETGLVVRVSRLVGLYTDPGNICEYPDGNIHQSYVALFECEVVGGSMRETDETGGWHWLSQEELEAERFRLIPDSALNCRDAWLRRDAALIR